MKCLFANTAIACLLLLSPIGYAEQPRDPGDLPDFFEGEWTLKGREDTFHEKCSWLSPNSYLICQGSDTDPKDPSQWVTLLGYSHAEDMYNFNAFNGRGGQARYLGWLRGGDWIFSLNREKGKELLRTQIRISPTKDGFFLHEEDSVNGGPWKTTLEEEHVRIPSKAS